MWLQVNAFLVIAGCIALIASVVPQLLYPMGLLGHPFAFLGGLVFLPLFLVIAVVQYRAVYRPKVNAAHVMMGSSYGGAAICVFGTIANIGEALLYGKDANVLFLLTFGIVGVSIAIYFVMLGVLHQRWTSQLRKSQKARAQAVA